VFTAIPDDAPDVFSAGGNGFKAELVEIDGEDDHVHCL
jgi:hypothetical protein